MQEYCLSREELDFVMSVTHFKSKAEWSEDPMKGVETKVKSAFTRTFNQSGSRAKCNIAVDEFKRKRGRGKGAAAPSDDLEPCKSQIRFCPLITDEMNRFNTRFHPGGEVR